MAVEQLRRDVENQFHALTLSKKYCDLRELERRYYVINDLKMANDLKRQGDELEQFEVTQHQSDISLKVKREQDRLRKQHHLQVRSMRQRIYRDRQEQLIHRQKDSQVLVQRNKNILADVLEQQQIETRNTQSFLRYALGRRVQNDSHSRETSFERESRVHVSSLQPKKTFKTPHNVSVIARSGEMFSGSHHRRPVDLIRHEIRDSYNSNATLLRPLNRQKDGNLPSLQHQRSKHAKSNMDISQAYKVDRADEKRLEMAFNEQSYSDDSIAK